MKRLAKIFAFVTLSFAFLAGCSQMGDNGGLTGLGQVARNTCRQPAPMPVYTKGEKGTHWSK